MAALKNSIVLLCLLSDHVFAAGNHPAISIQNHLSRCIKISQDKLADNQSEMPTARFLLHHITSTADCGCKSTVSAYTTYVQRGTYQSFLLNANLLLSEKKDSIVLPLAVDAKLVAGQTVKIVFSCAAPD